MLSSMTHPPSFPMENKKDKCTGLPTSTESYIRKLQMPIFDKVLQETLNNHTMVGLSQKSKCTTALYNPHNYRLYFSFKRDTFKAYEGMVGVWFGLLKNYNTEFTATGENVRITVKKIQVEVINKLSEQEWFTIQKSKAKEEIVQILEKIDNKCKASLQKFISIYGGATDYVILKRSHRPDMLLNTKCDNKVMQEEFIDNIDLKTEFETPIVKKVYKEPNVEFKEPIYAAQYLENSALNDFAPEIANFLKYIISLQGSQIEATRLEVENKKLHMEVLREMKDSLKEISNYFHIDKIRKIKEAYKSEFGKEMW